MIPPVMSNNVNVIANCEKTYKVTFSLGATRGNLTHDLQDKSAMFYHKTTEAVISKNRSINASK